MKAFAKVVAILALIAGVVSMDDNPGKAVFFGVMALYWQRESK